MSGVLERALPELGASIAAQRSESELDPIAALHWPRLTRLQQHGFHAYRGRPEKLLAAALVLDATEDSSTTRRRVAGEVAQRLGLGEDDERSLIDLVDDAGLLLAASRRMDGLMEEPVLQLAAHVVTREQAEALYTLALSGPDELESRDRVRVEALHDLLLATLTHPELVGRTPSGTVAQRRRDAAQLVTNQDALERIEHAPRRYVLATAPDDLARQVLLCDPMPRPTTVRVEVTPGANGWTVDVVARDRPGLLARDGRAHRPWIRCRIGHRRHLGRWLCAGVVHGPRRGFAGQRPDRERPCVSVSKPHHLVPCQGRDRGVRRRRLAVAHVGDRSGQRSAGSAACLDGSVRGCRRRCPRRSGPYGQGRGDRHLRAHQRQGSQADPGCPRASRADACRGRGGAPPSALATSPAELGFTAAPTHRPRHDLSPQTRGQIRVRQTS